MGKQEDFNQAESILFNFVKVVQAAGGRSELETVWPELLPVYNDAFGLMMVAAMQKDAQEKA